MICPDTGNKKGDKMCDYINRQDAIDAIMERADKASKGVGIDNPFWEGLIIAASIIEWIPSADRSEKEVE